MECERFWTALESCYEVAYKRFSHFLSLDDTCYLEDFEGLRACGEGSRNDAVNSMGFSCNKRNVWRKWRSSEVGLSSRTVDSSKCVISYKAVSHKETSKEARGMLMIHSGRCSLILRNLSKRMLKTMAYKDQERNCCIMYSWL